MMRQTFIWIDFEKKENQDAPRSEIAELQDMNGLTERDISDLKKSYAKRLGKTGGVLFGLQCTKKIKSLMHPVHQGLNLLGTLKSKEDPPGFSRKLGV